MCCAMREHMTGRAVCMRVVRLVQLPVFGEALAMESNVDTVSMCSDDTVGEVEWARTGWLRTPFPGLDDGRAMRSGWCKQRRNQMHQCHRVEV